MLIKAVIPYLTSGLSVMSLQAHCRNLLVLSSIYFDIYSNGYLQGLPLPVLSAPGVQGITYAIQCAGSGEYVVSSTTI